MFSINFRCILLLLCIQSNFYIILKHQKIQIFCIFGYIGVLFTSHIHSIDCVQFLNITSLFLLPLLLVATVTLSSPPLIVVVPFASMYTSL